MMAQVFFCNKSPPLSLCVAVEGTSSGIAFWDVVILTTTDAAQQQVYELEIKSKLKKKELPSCAHYHVVYDPPGAKIGTGN